MTVTERFARQLDTLEQLAGGRPELVADRLAAACASAVPCDGVGLSVFSGAIRFPAGSSDRTTATAEKLQFTTGEGPCIEAHASGRPVFADEATLAASWPAFGDELKMRTPFRAVVSLPIEGLNEVATMDLYFHDPDALVDVDVVEVQDVSRRMSGLLTAAHEPSGFGGQVPAWMDGPGVVDRFQLSVALGMIAAGSGLSLEDALASLRATAYGSARDVDDVAAEVVGRRIDLSAKTWT